VNYGRMYRTHRTFESLDFIWTFSLPSGDLGRSHKGQRGGSLSDSWDAFATLICPVLGGQRLCAIPAGHGEGSRIQPVSLSRNTSVWGKGLAKAQPCIWCVFVAKDVSRKPFAVVFAWGMGHEAWGHAHEHEHEHRRGHGRGRRVTEAS
jgi:hypothetical protein